MREWNRYLVVNNDASVDSHPGLSDYYDHKLMPGGSEGVFATQEDFLRAYAPFFPRRYEHYHRYLKNHISKQRQGLSIGSGQCLNELCLLAEGYDIHCSDIRESFHKAVPALFPKFRFTKLDIVSSAFFEKMDYVIALSVLFCFDKDQLLQVFKNVAASLKPGGYFITEPSGAEDNVVTYILDNYLCKYDVHLQYWIKRFLLGRNVKVAKLFQGYRFLDEEIVEVAQKAGFMLEDLHQCDPVTEFKDRLLLFNRLPDPVVSFLGRAVPYIRLFKFVKV